MVAWTVLGSLLWLGVPPAAAGEDHHRVSVQDRDARSLCRAEATEDHHCVSIQDADTRASARGGQPGVSPLRLHLRQGRAAPAAAGRATETTLRLHLRPRPALPLPPSRGRSPTTACPSETRTSARGAGRSPTSRATTAIRTPTTAAAAGRAPDPDRVPSATPSPLFAASAPPARQRTISRKGLAVRSRSARGLHGGDGLLTCRVTSTSWRKRGPAPAWRGRRGHAPRRRRDVGAAHLGTLAAPGADVDAEHRNALVVADDPGALVADVQQRLGAEGEGEILGSIPRSSRSMALWSSTRTSTSARGRVDIDLPLGRRIAHAEPLVGASGARLPARPDRVEAARTHQQAAPPHAQPPPEQAQFAGSPRPRTSPRAGGRRKRSHRAPIGWRDPGPGPAARRCGPCSGAGRACPAETGLRPDPAPEAPGRRRCGGVWLGWHARA